MSANGPDATSGPSRSLRVREMAPMCRTPHSRMQLAGGDQNDPGGHNAGGPARERLGRQQDGQREGKRDHGPAAEQPSADPRHPVCM